MDTIDYELKDSLHGYYLQKKEKDYTWIVGAVIVTLLVIGIINL